MHQYTIECGIVYFKSLLRGSILYATEAMVNLKENEIKVIERTEEATLRDLVKTEQSAPRYLLYLELGIIPARFVIKQRKVMHFKHILMQHEDSLIKKVFNAQIKSPSKGDWVSVVKDILKDLQIHKTMQELQGISKNQLSKVVKLAIEKSSFTYLISYQKQKQKGRDIKYTNLVLQPYMISRENFDIKSQRKTFAFRTKINHIKANFVSSKDIEKCEKCHEDMDNIHLFKCTRININNINYNHILNGKVLEQRNAINYIN